MRQLICKFFFIGVAVSFLFYESCWQKEGTGLPKIRYGKDLCNECGMIISEEQFVTTALDSEGNTLRFDEIGCMVLYQAKHPNLIKHSWVHDYLTKEWIEADKAYYVSGNDTTAPMGYGIVGFSSQKEAEGFARSHGGQVVAMRDLAALVNRQKSHVVGSPH